MLLDGSHCSLWDCNELPIVLKSMYVFLAPLCIETSQAPLYPIFNVQKLQILIAKAMS